MYEEQRLAAAGFPSEDAAIVCHSMRRAGAMDEFMAEVGKESHHCTCGGKHKCKDCPNRKDVPLCTE